MKNRAPLWAIVTVIAALVLAPAAAVAATTLVTITGGGNQAWVDKAHRLLSSEADPANLVNTSLSATTQGCQAVFTVPEGKHLIVKTMDFVAPPPFSSNSSVKVYPNGDCSGKPIAGSDIFFGSSCCDPNDHVDFGAGAVVNPGQSLSVTVAGTNPIDVYLHGYLAPGKF